MWGLVFAVAAAASNATCVKELGGDEIARQVCQVPNITIQEARELYYTHLACEALKKAVEVSGRRYKWVEIKGNDGYTARCAVED